MKFWTFFFRCPMQFRVDCRANGRRSYRCYLRNCNTCWPRNLFCSTKKTEELLRRRSVPLDLCITFTLLVQISHDVLQEWLRARLLWRSRMVKWIFCTTVKKLLTCDIAQSIIIIFLLLFEQHWCFTALHFYMLKLLLEGEMKMCNLSGSFIYLPILILEFIFTLRVETSSWKLVLVRGYLESALTKIYNQWNSAWTNAIFKFRNGMRYRSEINSRRESAALGHFSVSIFFWASKP